jgi:hypothetical protein
MRFRSFTKPHVEAGIRAARKTHPQPLQSHGGRLADRHPSPLCCPSRPRLDEGKAPSAVMRGSSTSWWSTGSRRSRPASTTPMRPVFSNPHQPRCGAESHQHHRRHRDAKRPGEIGSVVGVRVSETTVFAYRTRYGRDRRPAPTHAPLRRRGSYCPRPDHAKIEMRRPRTSQAIEQRPSKL